MQKYSALVHAVEVAAGPGTGRAADQFPGPVGQGIAIAMGHGLQQRRYFFFANAISRRQRVGRALPETVPAAMLAEVMRGEEPLVVDELENRIGLVFAHPAVDVRERIAEELADRFVDRRGPRVGQDLLVEQFHVDEADFERFEEHGQPALAEDPPASGDRQVGAEEVVQGGRPHHQVEAGVLEIQALGVHLHERRCPAVPCDANRCLSITSNSTLRSDAITSALGNIASSGITELPAPEQTSRIRSGSSNRCPFFQPRAAAFSKALRNKHSKCCVDW